MSAPTSNDLWEDLLAPVAKMEGQIKTLKAQRDDAEKDAARLYFHLQHHTGECIRGCGCEQCAAMDAHELRVAGRGVAQTAAEAALNAIFEEVEGYADGAPDATMHDKLANWVAYKCRPFVVKPKASQGPQCSEE